MSEQIEKLTTRLADSRAYLNNVLDQVGERWDVQVYSDGLQWTIRQLLMHLAAADLGHNNQVMTIAEGNEVIPEVFDLERYNRRTTEKTADKSVEQARAELAETRKALNAWLAELDEARLGNKGRHASLHVLSVKQILNLIARHERDHAEDIARALEITV